MRISSARHRAFTLPELLFAIGILAIFGLAATKLFHATMRISHVTAQQQDAASSFESALSLLRADAWSAAAEMTTPDAGTAKVGGVTWSVTETTLTRDAGDGSRPRKWTVPAGLSFTMEDAALVVRVPPRGGERSLAEVRVASQTTILSRLTS